MTTQEARLILEFEKNLNLVTEQGGLASHRLLEILDEVVPQGMEARLKNVIFTNWNSFTLQQLTIQGSEFGTATDSVTKALNKLRDAAERSQKLIFLIKEQLKDPAADLESSKAEAYQQMAIAFSAIGALKNLLRYQVPVANNVLINAVPDLTNHLLRGDVQLLIKNYSNYVSEIGIEGGEFSLEEATNRLRKVEDFIKRCQGDESLPNNLNQHLKQYIEQQNGLLQAYQQKSYFDDEMVQSFDESNSELHTILEVEDQY